MIDLLALYCNGVLASAISVLISCDQPHAKATANAPIRIFDSGIGGLSIAQEIAKRLPHERLIYFADTAHVYLMGTAR